MVSIAVTARFAHCPFHHRFHLFLLISTIRLLPCTPLNEDRQYRTPLPNNSKSHHAILHDAGILSVIMESPDSKKVQACRYTLER